VTGKAILLSTLLLAFPLYGQGAVPSATTAATATAPTTSTAPASTSSMSQEEVAALRQLKLERDVENAVLQWAKSRFWWGAFALILIGFFGLKGFIRELVSNELTKATAATAKADIAADQTLALTKELRGEAAQYRTLVGDLSLSAETVDGTLKQLQKRIDELGSRIEAEGSHAVVAADQKIAAVTQQVNELSELVKTLATESHESREALRAYDARIASLDRSTEQSREDFAANSKYTIWVTPTEDPRLKEIADYLIQELGQLGFKTTRWTWAGTSDPEMITVRIGYAPGDDALAQRISVSVSNLLRLKNIDHRTTFAEDSGTHQKKDVVWVFLA